MELRAGYKQTEIGAIPLEWEIKTYGEVFDYLGTATYSRAELTESDDVRYIHYGDIHTKWNFFLDIDKSNLPTVREEQVKNYDLLKEGDIVMADASEDYSGICKSVEIVNLGHVKAIAGLHTFLLRDNNGVFVNGFRAYIHFNKLVKSQFDRLATGLKVYGVSKTNLKTVQLPVPTKPEQTAIAKALSDTDTLINNLETLIAKKRCVRQGARQKLLEPKEGWELKKLGEIAEFYNGKAHEQFISESGEFIVVNSKFVATDGEIYKSSFENLFPLEKDDITMVMSDIPNGKALAKCFIIPQKNKYALNQRICAIRTTTVDYKFLYFILNRNKYYLAFDSGTGQTNLKRNEVLDCPLYLPTTKEEQIEIAKILSDMDAEIELLETKLEKYQNLKLGMMQNLLTGKIRL